MKVILVCETFGVHEQRFSRAFENSGHIVESLLFDDPTFDGPLIGRHELHAETEEPIIVFGGPLHLSGKLSKLAKDIPFIGVSYAYDVLYLCHHDAQAKKEIVKSLSRCDGLVADCRAAEKESLHLSGERSIPTCVAPWGLDRQIKQVGCASSTKTMRERFGWGDERIIVSTRRWTSLHGVDYVVDAFLSLAQHRSDIRLLLVGGGEMEKLLRERVAAAGISERVGFAGHVDESEISSILEQSDVYVSSSVVDGISISLLQALDAGLPVVLSDVGGNQEWKPFLGAPLFFPVGDTEALARAMEFALDNYKREAGQWSELLEKKANWQANSLKIVRFVESIAEQKIAENSTL
jgi:glycosyltransferase involved in cell wall biosynthesis